MLKNLAKRLKERRRKRGPFTNNKQLYEIGMSQPCSLTLFLLYLLASLSLSLPPYGRTAETITGL
jgi:hypothetical protein